MCKPWQRELYDYLAEHLLPLSASQQTFAQLEGSRPAKCTKVDELPVNIDAIIAKLSEVDIGVQEDRDTVKFDARIIDYPASEDPIAHRFKPFNNFRLTDCIGDLSLLDGKQEVILFGAVVLDSIDSISAAMRSGAHASAAAAFGVMHLRTPGGKQLVPTDIITPDRAPGIKPKSPWRKAIAEEASQHIALSYLLDKIQQLFSLDKINRTQAYKIAALVLEHDKNPLMHAWQWILFSLKKQGIYIVNKLTLNDEAGLFFISTETKEGKVYLWMQFAVDVTGVYIAEEGVIESHEPLMSIKLSCKISLADYSLQPHAYSVVVKHAALNPKVINAASELKANFSAWQQELKDQLQAKQSRELVYLFPLSLPIPESLWQEYLKLSITPRELLDHVEKNSEAIGDFEKQAEKDYGRMVAVKGVDLPKTCGGEGGLYNISKVRAYIDTCFPGCWQDWQQTILNIFIAQQFFNPTESLWYQLLTILDATYNLQLQSRFGIDGTNKLYNLTRDSRGRFCLNGGFQVFKIHHKITGAELTSPTPLVSVKLQIIFPVTRDTKFVFDMIPKITIHPACVQYANTMVPAIYAMTCRKQRHFDKIDCTRIIESLRAERLKHEPPADPSIRCNLFGAPKE